MENTLLVGLSRQMALTHELDVIANNIANINTTGRLRPPSLHDGDDSPPGRPPHGRRRVD